MATQEQFILMCLNIVTEPESLRTQTEKVMGNVNITDKLHDKLSGRGDKPFDVMVQICPYNFAYREQSLITVDV